MKTVGYAIRAVSTIPEYVEYFRLRYDVYTALGYLRSGNSAGLEIDEFDAYAIAIGAFDLSSGALVATLRLVTQTRQPDQEGAIRRILADCGDPDLARKALAARPHPLPALLSDEIERLVAACNPEGLPLYEPGRGIVRPDRRGAWLTRSLYEFGVARMALAGPAAYVGGCLREHLPMYAKFGMLPLPGIGPQMFDSVSQLGYVIFGRGDQMPEPNRTRVAHLLREMRSGVSTHIVRNGH